MPFLSKKTSPKPNESKQGDAGVGLLPSTQVNVANASTPTSGNVTMAAGHVGSSAVSRHHDAAYYEKWNKERQEAIARGEDPNAKFLALVKEREAQSKLFRLKKFILGRKEDKETESNDQTAESNLKESNETKGAQQGAGQSWKKDEVIR